MSDRKTICVIIGDISYDYTEELMQGMSEAAAQQGVELFYMTGKQKHIASIDSDKESDTVKYYNSIYDYADMVGADAFIISCGSISGFTEDRHYQELLKRFEGKKRVVLHRELARAPGQAVILVDNYDSVCQLTEHLIRDHGYRKIAFVSGPPSHPDGSVRERAYRDTMEKHGLVVEQGMLCHGDLSGFVSPEVNRLLDDFADLEAIMFCNDEMVRTAYQVLSQRGLLPGRDIAVTGFDDFTTGRTLSPPLTTISQQSMQTGYLAVMTALDLMSGKQPPVVRMKTQVHLRASCGCAFEVDGSIFEDNSTSEPEYISRVTDRLRDDLMQMFAQDGHSGISDLINRVMNHAAQAALAWKGSAQCEAEFSAWLDSGMGQYSAIVAQIAHRLHSHVLQAAGLNMGAAGLRLNQALMSIEGALYAYEVHHAAQRYNRIRMQAWFAQEFIRDLVISEDEDESVFRRAVDRLRQIGLEKVHICLLPVPHRAGRHTQTLYAGSLHLAAYQDAEASIAYPRTGMPVFDAKTPLSELPGLKGKERLITLGIFSGDVLYGVLLCEADRNTLPILHIIGLQLGMLANFIDLKAKECIVQSELDNTRERIEVLSFLSDYDPMCNVYNRRGFIEQAIRLNRDNEGRQAFCAFLDLDNLKRINDTFGHTAGDDALIAAANILKRAVRSRDLVARVGGDEFIVLLLVDDSSSAVFFSTRLTNLFTRYNKTSDKPYILSASIGITEFTCQPGLEISKVIERADRKLYAQKIRKDETYRKTGTS